MTRARASAPERQPSVPCSACGGAGHVPLVPSLSEAFAALADGPRTATELARALSTSPTAMINRLEELRAFGLVTRERVARGYRYARKP